MASGAGIIPILMTAFLLPNGTWDSHMHAVDWPGATLQNKKIGCFNHLVVTLVGRDSGKKKFILVLEVNCMSNLSPNHTLQLTTLRTAVSHYKKNVWWFCGDSLALVTISARYYCMLFDVHAGVTSFNDACYDQWLLHLQDWKVLELPLWLSYAISKIHNT